jgi:hypothetical protein
VYNRYSNSTTQNRKTSTAKTSSLRFNIDDAWAAVAHADRINQGRYVNDRTCFQPGEIVKAHNKTIAYQALDRQEILTEEDRKFGQELAGHFSGLLFRTIKGTTPSPGTLVGGKSFMDTIADIVAMEAVGKYEVACMSCLPNTYRKDLQKEKRKEQMFELSAKSEYIGMEGSKQELTLNVLETFYSQKFSSLIVTTVCGNNIVKFFTSKDVDSFPKGKDIKIKGNVKHTSVNERTGGKETWLTRVKVVE